LPDYETNFNQLKDNLFNQLKYYLLTEITIDELLNEEFIHKFVKNGEIYMQSHNTRLDCHDCACLQPNGNLILNLTQETNEKMPLECVKTSTKSTGFNKYGEILSFYFLLHSIKN
jgi:hypothetical protein